MRYARTMQEDKPRLAWEPAIYEHKAALIGESPGAVSRSADLLARALLAEYETYRSDYMTVGIDVYNVEAETVGAVLSESDERSCPEIRTPHLSVDDFVPPPLPDGNAGRFPLLIQAARIASDALGGVTELRIAASGPVSIAAKLVGIERLIIGLAMDEPGAVAALAYAESLVMVWIETIRNAGFEAILFDSNASPPVCSPAMYEAHVAPRHRRIMHLLEKSGQKNRALILGGDTTPIVTGMCGAGATIIICDYAAKAAPFAEALSESGNGSVEVRRNIDPAQFTRAGSTEESAVEAYLSDLRRFQHPIAGTGILPFDAVPEAYLAFKSRVTEEF